MTSRTSVTDVCMSGTRIQSEISSIKHHQVIAVSISPQILILRCSSLHSDCFPATMTSERRSVRVLSSLNTRWWQVKVGLGNKSSWSGWHFFLFSVQCSFILPAIRNNSNRLHVIDVMCYMSNDFSVIIFSYYYRFPFHYFIILLITAQSNCKTCIKRWILRQQFSSST